MDMGVQNEKYKIQLKKKKKSRESSQIRKYNVPMHFGLCFKSMLISPRMFEECSRN